MSRYVIDLEGLRSSGSEGFFADSLRASQVSSSCPSASLTAPTLFPATPVSVLFQHPVLPKGKTLEVSPSRPFARCRDHLQAPRRHRREHAPDRA